LRRSLIAALLIGGQAMGCGNAPSPTSDPTTPNASTIAVAGATMSPSSSPSPTSTASPVQAAPLDPSAAPAQTPKPWQTFRSKRYHYIMKYPPNWVVTEAASDSDAFHAFGYPVMFVFRDKANGTISVNLTVMDLIAVTKRLYHANLTSNTAISIAGWGGRLLKFTGTESGVKIAIQRIVVGKGSVGYFIDLRGRLENSAVDRALFRKMYLTWRPT
jgi:hypothetical protein